jgi:predicted metal-binding protein
MKHANCPWSKTFVGVCIRCHEGLDHQMLSMEGNAGENLKNFLKAQMRVLGHAGEVRVVTTSCLALCPLAQQAVVVAKNGETPKMYALHPEKDREELLEHLIK